MNLCENLGVLCVEFPTMKLQIRSAAKVNLTLDVLARRADGYHQLASIVHTVGIWDEIEVEICDGGEIAFSCNREELAGEENLCVRAVRQWNHATGENRGARIQLQKRIPTGAGLGGGSGNAAAILLALNRASKNPLSSENLRAIGAKLGADVPLFLQGGAVLMEGIGEKLTPLAPLSGWLLIVKPQLSLSTPAVYRAWDEGDFKSRNDTPQLLEIWSNGDLNRIAANMGNDLERAAAPITDVPARLIELLNRSGAIGARMSGSGSACFALFASQTAARNAAQQLETALAKDVHLRASHLFVAPFSGRGVEFLD